MKINTVIIGFAIVIGFAIIAGSYFIIQNQQLVEQQKKEDALIQARKECSNQLSSGEARNINDTFSYGNDDKYNKCMASKGYGISEFKN